LAAWTPHHYQGLTGPSSPPRDARRRCDPDLPGSPPPGEQPPLSIRAVGASCRVPPSHPTHGCRNLLPARHRLRPLAGDLGLGSDSPWDVCRCPGTLRLPVWRVHHRHSRYSFRHSRLWALHPALPVRLHRCPQRSPTIPCFVPTPKGVGRRLSAASGDCLSPVTLSAQGHSTSELLRTLSRMAASKPTSWLSAHPHHLCHSAAL
jgi:hypothetical protein